MTPRSHIKALLRGLGLVLLLAGATSSAVAYAADPSSGGCPQDLESMPIQAGGRVKPLRVHAKDVMQFLTGKTTCDGLDATAAYCEASLQSFFATPSPCRISLRIDHRKTRALLNMKPFAGQIDPEEAKAMLVTLQNAYRNLAAQKEEKGAEGKDLATTLAKIALYEELISGHDWMIPVAYDNKEQWISAYDLHAIKPEAFQERDSLFALLGRLKTSYTVQAGDRYLLELVYDKAQPFSWALGLAFIALAAAAVSKKGRSPLLIACVAGIFAVEIAAITVRILISGRGPVTNMYETVMWVGMGSLFFATVLSILKKEKLYILCGLALHILCLFMINFAHGMLDPSIKPLVPVLRNNYWLSTHVTTVTISYAAFALSWGLANYCMLRDILGRGSRPVSTDEAEGGNTLYWNSLIYDAIKIGVVLIAAGVILGGIWADYSWGRFWGWDPKETWALIVLMTYIVILHGRHAKWIPRDKFIPLVALAFLTVLMAWFGVNYILATGLHSYGFSEGGTLFIATLVIAQLAIVGLYLLRGKRRPQ